MATDPNWMRAIEDAVYAAENDGESAPDLRGLSYRIPQIARRYGQVLTDSEIEQINKRVTKRCRA